MSCQGPGQSPRLRTAPPASKPCPSQYTSWVAGCCSGVACSGEAPARVARAAAAKPTAVPTAVRNACRLLRRLREPWRSSRSIPDLLLPPSWVLAEFDAGVPGEIGKAIRQQHAQYDKDNGKDARGSRRWFEFVSKRVVQGDREWGDVRHTQEQ